MNEHIQKRIDYFTYEQFMNELDELKKDYYVIGYIVNNKDDFAIVELVKRGTKNEWYINGTTRGSRYRTTG